MKIATLRSQNESEWVSCQSITSNLLKCYDSLNANNEVKHLEYPTCGNSFSISSLVRDIHNQKFETLSFVDHDLVPLSILRVIKNECPNWKPKVIFHIFGDFTLNSVQWADSEDLLVHFNIVFVSSSPKQTELVKSFMATNDKESICKTLPFPVDCTDFIFNAAKRKEKRSSLNIADNETVYLYTGRLSLQKNISEMINLYAKSIQLSNEKSKLLIAGEFDDLGLPYTGLHLSESAYLLAVMKIILTLPKSLQEQIIFVGNVDREQLIDLYNASDYFLSLSTHNDEDYGMSPAEAMCCGLPMILTNWGGFSSFCHPDYESTHYVDVKDNRDRIIPNSVEAIKCLIKTLGSIPSNELRTKNSKIGKDLLSISANKFVLEKIIYNLQGVQTFTGFDKKLKKMATLFRANKYAPFRGPERKLVQFYYELYRPYIN